MANVEYVSALLDMSKPTSKRQLHGFIGICSWLQEYAPDETDLAITITSITDLLQGKRSFNWTVAVQDIFRAMEEAFNRPLKLLRPMADLMFVVQADGSGCGMGAVLLQQRLGGRRNLTSHASE